jgi:hypothetical protein
MARHAAPNPSLPPQRGDAELRRLHHFKSARTESARLIGPGLIEFFKQSVEKRQGKLERIGTALSTLIPSTLLEHCCVESLNRGTLIVLVDSASHMYELKQLLLAGLEKQVMLACKSAGLRKIMLKSGRWYSGDGPTDRKPQF